MNSAHQYLICPQRLGNPRVALEVCRICTKAKRCQAWRDFTCPALFPGLEANLPHVWRRPPRAGTAKRAAQQAQAPLPLASY